MSCGGCYPASRLSSSEVAHAQNSSEVTIDQSAYGEASLTGTVIDHLYHHPSGVTLGGADPGHTVTKADTDP